ncbi:hypothetical protein IMG5_204800 [Ichthyophthirius multifiliis]|uniref:Uncharacterized protein n=1 Tax=Ichthyophthirius multifiliis TaxID=5932 RepID=G0R6I5_ICHMU|nr:hypothetical protein IMG5_204800 [Ichthyophthirius multifiliis]EGR26922.1 hypothetical protein IMG5_204800 [Ichthyophthirius multifiliis]|eukprot:XP_004023806.1 hypothetical protein IMG5_204800 [Ichthyophthirius multifiliis]
MYMSSLVANSKKQDDICICDPLQDLIPLYVGKTLISCDQCPDNLIINQEKTKCICPNNSELLEDGQTCGCTGFNTIYSPQSNSCDCKPGHIISTTIPNLNCLPKPQCHNSCLQCKTDTDECIKCPSQFQLSSDKKYCIPSQCDPICQKCDPETLLCIDCPPAYSLSADKKSCKPSHCHPSCHCEISDGECGTCSKCTRCRQSEISIMVNQDFCICKSPEYKRKIDSTWECEKQDVVFEVPKCVWLCGY